MSPKLLPVLLLLIYAACSRPTDPALRHDPGFIIAQINDIPVHSELFEETYITFLSRTGFADTPQQRYNHLNTLIDTWLMSEEATRRGLNDTQFEDYLHKTRKRTLRNLFLRNNLSVSEEDITDPEVRLAFYRTKQKPYVRQLFFTDAERAEQYWQRLESGEDFINLANEVYHTPRYDSLAGYLGEISYFGVDDIFAETAFTLNAGEYSRPVRTRQGYVIIRVENWNFNPIVTETEYITRQEKVRFFAYQRAYNIGADTFIREYMSALDPQLIRGNLQQVYLLIQRMLPQTQAAVGTNFMDQPLRRGDQQQFLEVLDPMMPLITYTIDGQTQAFRLQDYVMWMEFLPYEEVVGRFDASIGRALMWDVFAKEAEKQGLGEHPFVEYNARAAGRFHQASRMTDTLRARPAPPVSDEDILTAFEMLGMGTMRQNNVTFWYASATSFNQARQIQQQLQTGQLRPASVPGVTFHTRADASQIQPDLAPLLHKALPRTIQIAGTGETWYVFEVSDRETIPYTVEDRREDIEAMVKPAYNEFLLLRELRQQARISVDTTAFHRLMNYYETMPRN